MSRAETGPAQPIRAGVIGAGVFGALHARKYASLDGVRLSAVYDPDPTRAAALAEPLGAIACADLGALLEAVDVASVTSPADTHADAADQALSAGLHVYVEKPLAVSLRAGEAVVRQAHDRRLVLACGHQERVVFRAMGVLDAPQTPRSLDSVRRGTPNDRNRDVSCVLDLMIHDLDLALSLGGGLSLDGGAAAGAAWTAVDARGGFDEVQAEVVLRGGMKARFEASRIAARRERTMRIGYEAGSVEIDFLAPAFRNTAPFGLNPDFATTPQGRDPLGANIAGFLAAVRGEMSEPIVTGEAGLTALALALEIERAAGL